MNKFETPIFIDSGAHGLYAEYVQKTKPKPIEGTDQVDKYWKYKEDAFYEYIDTYIAFIKQYKQSITVYANVDVIFNPEHTWDAQIYCEKHGINPIPVIHFGTPMKWLKRYLALGYEYIALGGLGQEANQKEYIQWADQAFDVICDQPSRLPKVKVHGFAMTAVELMRRYPWYSVDSTTFLTFTAYGQILVPPRINSKWMYDRRFNIIRVSEQESKAFNKTAVRNSHKSEEVRVVMDYIAEKGFILGKSEVNGKEVKKIEVGLCNSDGQRACLNALYFIDFAENQPKWPWPFYEKEKQQTILQ